MSLYAELKRRNVFRVAIAYLAAAWLITEVTETIFPLFGYSDTPARIVVILLAIGFPLFVIFSWVYEFTPDGLKLEKDVVREESITPKTGKRIDRLIMILLALGLAYFAFDRFVLDPIEDVQIAESAHQEGRSEALTESYGDKSIAVLPFVNMSADPEQEFFSDGISEEVLNLLAQIPELRVISRSSAFYYKGKDVTLAEIARELNVVHVLEGSVRKAGARVRITAQLIEARSNSHLWSQTYDRRLDDIFDVQDEISAAIVGALRERLGLTVEAAPRVKAVENIDAYIAYLQGRELVRNRNQDRMPEAIGHLERALRLDDSLAVARAELAIAILLDPDRDVIQRIQAAMPHLDGAQELDPDLAEAHAGRALAAFLKGEWVNVIGHARKALDANRNYVDAMYWLLNGLAALGYYEESQALLQNILAIDPLSVPARAAYAIQKAWRGQIEEAHAIADQILEQSPFRGYVTHASISQWSEGELADSLSYALRVGHSAASYPFIWVGEYEEARRLDEYQTAFFEGILEGRRDAVVRLALEKLAEFPDHTDSIEKAAMAYHFAGRMHEALPLYERLWDLTPEGRPVQGWWPLTGTMRLAQTRRMTGDEAGAQAVAEVVRSDHSANIAVGYDSIELDLAASMLAAFEHDTGSAIAMLQRAVRRGLVIPVYLEEPVFNDLRNNPQFMAIRQEMDTRLAAEHEKVLQLICFNNPVPHDWQPMPETCEGVVDRDEL